MRIVYLYLCLYVESFATPVCPSTEVNTGRSLSHHEARVRHQSYQTQQVVQRSLLQSSYQTEDQTHVRKRRNAEITQIRYPNGISVHSCPPGFYYDAEAQICIDDEGNIPSIDSQARSTSQPSMASGIAEPSTVPRHSLAAEVLTTKHFSQSYEITPHTDKTLDEHIPPTTKLTTPFELITEENLSSIQYMSLKTQASGATTPRTIIPDSKVFTPKVTSEKSSEVTTLNEMLASTVLASTEETMSKESSSSPSSLNDARITMVTKMNNKTSQFTRVKNIPIAHQSTTPGKLEYGVTKTSVSFGFATSPQPSSAEVTTKNVFAGSTEGAKDLSSKADMHLKQDIPGTLITAKPIVPEEWEGNHAFPTASYYWELTSAISDSQRPLSLTAFSKHMSQVVDKVTPGYLYYTITDPNLEDATEHSVSVEHITSLDSATGPEERRHPATKTQVSSPLSTIGTSSVADSTKTSKVNLESTTNEIRLESPTPQGFENTKNQLPQSSFPPMVGVTKKQHRDLLKNNLSRSDDTPKRQKSTVGLSSREPTIFVTTPGLSTILSNPNTSTKNMLPDIAIGNVNQQMRIGNLTPPIQVTAPSEMSFPGNTTHESSKTVFFNRHTTSNPRKATSCESNLCSSTDPSTHVHILNITSSGRMKHSTYSIVKPTTSESTATTSRLQTTNRFGNEVTERSVPTKAGVEKSFNPVVHRKEASPVIVFVGALILSIFGTSLIAVASCMLRARKKNKLLYAQTF